MSNRFESEMRNITKSFLRNQGSCQEADEAVARIKRYLELKYLCDLRIDPSQTNRCYVSTQDHTQELYFEVNGGPSQLRFSIVDPSQFWTKSLKSAESFAGSPPRRITNKLAREVADIMQLQKKPKEPDVFI